MNNSFLPSVLRGAAGLTAILTFCSAANAIELVDYSHSAHTKTLSMTLWVDDPDPSCTAKIQAAEWPNSTYATVNVHRGFSENPRPEALMYFSYDIPAKYAGDAKQVEFECAGDSGELRETISFVAPPKFSLSSQVMIIGDNLRYQAQVYIDNQQADGVCTLFSTPVGMNLWQNQSPVSEPFWADYYNANMNLPLAEAPEFIQTAVQCQTRAGTTQHSRVWQVRDGDAELVHDQKSYF